jgi:hypothetical protein
LEYQVVVEEVMNNRDAKILMFSANADAFVLVAELALLKDNMLMLPFRYESRYQGGVLGTSQAHEKLKWISRG